MFGRLFGYLALIRSGRLQDDSKSALLALDRLVGLHKRKAWIREVVSEAVLFLLEEAELDDQSARSAAQRLGEILPAVGADLADMSAHEVVLVSGIQEICGSKKSLTALRGVVPTSRLLSPATLPDLAPTLLAACAGFPKVHRVWSAIMLSIFGTSGYRCLPDER